MSYIPNIRKKYKVGFSGEEDRSEINPYWHGFLNDKDYDAMLTYDFAANTVENFFENLDIYQEVFSDIIKRYAEVHGESTETAIYDESEQDVVNTPVFNKPGELSDEDIKSVSLQALLARTMYECMMEWLDMQRNELGVSMIDEMSEEEFEKIKHAVLSGKRRTEYTMDGTEEAEELASETAEEETDLEV